MDVKLISVLVVFAGLVPGSLQTDDIQEICNVRTIQNSLEANTKQEATVADDCTAGTIFWYNPEGELNLKFPRSMIPDLAESEKARFAMKVCFRGDYNHVTNITQEVTTFRGKKFKQPVPLGNSTLWTCGRPSRHADGAVFSLAATEKGDLEELEYTVEACARLCGWRREKKRKGGKRKMGRKRKGNKGRKWVKKGRKVANKLGKGGAGKLRKNKPDRGGRGRGGRRNKQPTEVQL